MQVLASIQNEKPDKKAKAINIKVSVEEFEALKVKAHRFAGGNVSGWIRHAGLSHVPDEKELINVEAGADPN